MTKEEKKLVMANAALWIIAILTHPVSRLVPTGSGDPPKIFSLMIPLFFLMLGAVSTWFLRTALKKD